MQYEELCMWLQLVGMMITGSMVGVLLAENENFLTVLCTFYATALLFFAINNVNKLTEDKEIGE